MYTKILLTLLFTLLTQILAAVSPVNATSGKDIALDNLPLATVPYNIGTIDEKATPGFYASGNVTGMDDFSGWYKCETTEGSPYASDVDNTGIRLNALGNQHCKQENGAGSRCTKMAHYYSAAVSVCGPYGDYIYCWRAGYAASTIAHKCYWKGRAGGYFVFDDPNSLKFPVHRN